MSYYRSSRPHRCGVGRRTALAEKRFAQAYALGPPKRSVSLPIASCSCWERSSTGQREPRRRCGGLVSASASSTPILDSFGSSFIGSTALGSRGAAFPFASASTSRPTSLRQIDLARDHRPRRSAFPSTAVETAPPTHEQTEHGYRVPRVPYHSRVTFERALSADRGLDRGNHDFIWGVV